MSRAIAEFQEQHQNRIAALTAEVEQYGQSGAASSTRAPRGSPGRRGRPGCAVRVIRADGTSLEFKSQADAAGYIGVSRGSVWNFLKRGGWYRGWRVERITAPRGQNGR